MRRRDMVFGLGMLPAAALAQVPATSRAPAVVPAESARPKTNWSTQVGDVTPGRALLWSRADRRAEMVVEYATNPRFQNARRRVAPVTSPASDFTARLDLTGLPTSGRIFYRVVFRNIDNPRAASEPITGDFACAPSDARPVRFLFSADTAGQGYGINPEFGGMRIYKTMLEQRPDFFVHCGDTIYADGPIPSEVKQPDGSIWKNVVTEAKSKVAESLDEFRGNYLYNLLDENVRTFNAAVPQLWQWDDHEVLNNWSASKDLSRFPQYTEKNLKTLVARASQAFREYAPISFDASRDRIYRKISYGALLDVFVIDMRSYRGPNTTNIQAAGADTVMLGRPQLGWLRRGLIESRATWKVIASDMPVGLFVSDGRDSEGRPMAEGVANGSSDGKPLGRELEIAELLRALKQARVKNTVWITGDVHYTAAHYYDPRKAVFTEFEPFWEFVSGPLNAGTFGPNQLDATFGPTVVWQKHTPPGQVGPGPSAGLQFFGDIQIDDKTAEMTVHLRDLSGQALHTQKLQPAS